MVVDVEPIGPGFLDLIIHKLILVLLFQHQLDHHFLILSFPVVKRDLLAEFAPNFISLFLRSESSIFRRKQDEWVAKDGLRLRVDFSKFNVGHNRCSAFTALVLVLYPRMRDEADHPRVVRLRLGSGNCFALNHLL